MVGKRGYSRRTFLLLSAGGLVAACGPPDDADISTAGDSHPAIPPEKIIRRSLGRTGLEVPIVGMGVMNTRDPALLVQSYRLGVRLFDTAPAYGDGDNERLVGRFLARTGARERIIVQSKVLHPVGIGFGRTQEPLSREQIRVAVIRKVEESLRRLGTDYLDILLYHAVDSPGRLRDPGVRDALQELKESGKVRFLGVSTHNARLVRDIAADDGLDILMAQLNVTLADDAGYLADLERVAAAGKGIIVMKTQGGNRLAPGIMNHRAVLKWALRHQWAAAAVPGYTSVAQLSENFSAALDLAYTPAEGEFLARRGLVADMGFCRLCRQCRDDCPRGVDVPALVRAHMYAFGYANPGLARDTLAAVAPGAGPDACAGCETCVVRCRHGVDIAADLARLCTSRFMLSG